MPVSKKYIIQLLALSIFIAAFSTTVYFIKSSLITASWPFLIIFFFVITMVLHQVLIKAADGKPAAFINKFMLVTTIKLIFYSIILIAYAISTPWDAKLFILYFFFLYLIYTIFDIIQILPVLKGRTK